MRSPSGVSASGSSAPAPTHSLSAHPLPSAHSRRTAALALAALGIVYGDIGTSPLYAVKECFHGLHAVAVTPQNVLGVLSLIIWSLVMVVGVKYVAFILRADNEGEGGIFALLALLGGPDGAKTRRHGALVVLMAAFGAALLYGDGVITPAISVLSAMEGLNVATTAAADYVVPLTCVVLFGLFLVQRHGTAAIGTVFGPVMVVWFAVLAALGLREIILHPAVLAAVDPRHAVGFFRLNHLHGMVVLGSVVLCITGGEALYADMGHFGRRPVRISWNAVVLPGLLLNYLGQGALLLRDPGAALNPFYALVPHALLYPMVALATAATIIASQAMISGVFSLTRQAVQLGFAPRLRIVHTSDETEGQIYLPFVNWALMPACIGLVLAFRESSRLAAAYGIAVTATMAITSVLYFLVLRRNLRWRLSRAVPLLIAFLAFDLAFLAANLLKVLDGGWFTLAVAALILAVMTTWRDGRALLAKRYADARVPLEVFLQGLATHPPHRTSGTAVFLSVSPQGVPIPLLHHLKHNEALHERVILLSILAADTPRVKPEDRLAVADEGQGFYRVVARYGFMETPAVPEILELLPARGLPLDIHATSFFLGRETVLPGGQGRMAAWRKHLFAIMARNAWNVSSFFGIPPGRVVELGSRVEL